MSEKKGNTKLSSQQIKFAEYLASGKSQRESYNLAYPSEKRADVTTDVNASRLLSNAKVFDYYQSLLKKTAEKSEITRERILNEYAKIGFSSIAHLHNTWVERKDFDKLTQDQKDSIQEISTQVRKFFNDDGQQIEVEFVKIKLYDKMKALDSIKSMLGFDAPIKTENNTTQSVIWEEIKTYEAKPETNDSI